MSQIEVGSVIPPHIKSMVDRILEPMSVNPRFGDYRDYLRGWLETRAEKEYEELIKRDSIPSDPLVVRLLCELAVARALVQWHEVRDEPPPKPSLSNL